MSLDALVAQLRQQPQFMRQVTAWRTLAPRGARTVPWPANLTPELQSAAQRQAIQALYAHQGAAVEAALRGDNLVLATDTASGKTLGYLLPVLHALLTDPTATALLLFPTKALAHDQLDNLQHWLAELDVEIALHAYDGDTPKRHRPNIRQQARLIVTNPDMLHLGILPHHTRWMRFLSGLRYLVLDEIHTYRGVFGSHVINVLRRLRRIANFYGADPHVLSASATIANPQKLAESLWEAPFTAVTEDGAPYGKRHVIFYNPPLRNPDLGLRASATAEALKLALRLLRADVQSIVFARSRLTVELLLRELRAEAMRAGFGANAIQGYRGGYLPAERRAIEAGLRSGAVRVVVATNALELGIDIGALDASLLVGYPGSIAGTRQQMGRAGRRATTALSLLIATPAPLDQYLITHPDYFFGGSPEIARTNPNALALLASQLACAAFELPFEPGESFGEGIDPEEILAELSAAGVLHQSHGSYTWIGEGYPAQAVSLRTATADNVLVQSAGQICGVVDRPSAARMVHEGAVYFHRGQAHLIESLDWEQGLALARPVSELDYYTVASEGIQIERINLHRQQENVLGQLTTEEVLVRSRPTAYRRVSLHNHTTLGWGEINLPEQLMETDACRLSINEQLVEQLAGEGLHLAPLDYGSKWPAIREQILARDKQHCRLCKATAEKQPLEVHHLTPLRSFMRHHPRAAALHLAHAPENLLTLCPSCHRKVERARGARTALSGLAALLRHLAPVFLMCDPSDLGAVIHARDPENKQPSIIVYDALPGGMGLSPELLPLWPQLMTAALERVRGCPCARGCPSCVGPAGGNEPGAKKAVRELLAAAQ